MNHEPLSNIEQEILEELIALTYKVPCNKESLARRLNMLSLTRQRVFLHWHQRQCAEYIEVTRPIWTAWENDTHRPNPLKLRNFLIHVLNVHYSRLSHFVAFPTHRAKAQ